MSLIKSDISPKVFYLTEKAKSWAETSVRSGETCDVYLAGLSLVNNKNYLVIHPDEDEYDKKIPTDYDGFVIKYPPTLGN